MYYRRENEFEKEYFVAIKNSLIKEITQEILKEALQKNQTISQIIHSILKEYLIAGELPISFLYPNNIDENILKIFDPNTIQKFIKDHFDGKTYLKQKIVLNPHFDLSQFDLTQELEKHSLILELPPLKLGSYTFLGEFSYDFIFTKNPDWKIYLFKEIADDDIEAHFLALILNEIFSIDFFHLIQIEYNRDKLKIECRNKFPKFNISLEKERSIEKLKSIVEHYILEKNLLFNESITIKNLEPTKSVLDENSLNNQKDFLSLCYEEIVFLDFSNIGDSHAN
jgi:hypothetical protein